MALGYEIGTIMKRESKVYHDDNITIKFDDIEGMPQRYIQVTIPSILFSPPWFAFTPCLSSCVPLWLPLSALND
jgi:hypothetical protein